MNKKFLFTLVVVLALASVSAAWATPQFELASPTTGKVYNAGDNVSIDGTITLDRSLLGATVTVKAYSKHYNITVPLAKKFYNFQENVPATISQINLVPLSWNLNANTQVGNDWKIIIDVDKIPAYSTSFESGFFTVSKTLRLKSNLNYYTFNLGDTMDATATAVTANGVPVEGKGNILFVQTDTGTVKADVTTVKDGLMSFRYPFNKEDVPGEYYLTLKITDKNGNIGIVTLTGIVLSGKLDLTCGLSGEEFLPGGNFVVSGNLQNAHNTSLREIPLVASLTPPKTAITTTYSGTTNENGNYNMVIDIPKLSEPGQYTLSVVAEDTDGNIGSCEKALFLNVERRLIVDFSLNSSWYYNESEINAPLHITNKGNVDLVGKASLFVDDVEVSSQDIVVEKGLDKTFRPFWIINGAKGTHHIYSTIKADGDVLYKSKPLEFTIFPKPPPKKIVTPAVWQLVLVVALIVIGILVIFKQKELKSYLWHYELKKKYKIQG